MGSCAAPSAKGDDKFITTDYLQQCHLDHIQQAATDARSFVEGMAKDDFLADKRTQQAVIMSLIVIGEAATKVMDGYVEFTQAHADVPWRSMRNMRNRMAHGYFDINLDVVWETVQEWLPALLQQLPAVRQDADDEDRNDNCERGISDDC
ncbi:DUF86 domain-containing protein (plasmid) [Salmonella enterica]|uniref:HepT-like ribonuclease domain-containing protein n=1 Tax=Salmonella enterica TaxID=28901 RepID=UPI001E534AF2|nr:DUF86 domain-containing protein [Salmonella enterica]UGT33538.1 DUF86 domain-containing protein [Salmonella enterica]